jgi:hypothetical protein
LSHFLLLISLTGVLAGTPKSFIPAYYLLNRLFFQKGLARQLAQHLPLAG